MEIKTFRADSLQEALQLVRSELGPDASVVHTRELKQSKLGFFRKTVVEVEASLDVAVASRYPGLAHRSQPASPVSAPPQRAPEQPVLSQPHAPATYPPRTQLQRPMAAAIGMPAPHGGGAVSVAAEPPPAYTSQPAWDIPQAPVAHHNSLPPAAVELLSEMLERGISPQSATRLLRDVCDMVPADQQGDPWLLKGQASQLVAKRVNVSGSIEVGEGEAQVVALVGPTGVGKTTTLAKIAAGFRFDLGLDVGMITIDTFRLGAVDQLLQYAELISSPLEVVSSPDQITGALQRLRECDLILIDTAGRSPRDAEQLAVLKEFMDAAQPDAIHLVVSASASVENARDTIQRFQSVSPTNLILSKIDESVQFGSWFDLLSDCQLPVSYVTTGQHVPQDISVASRRRVASLLLGNSQHQEHLA